MLKKTIPFIKMAGAGNDFVVIDAVKGLNLRALARKMCHRTDGIGSDGLLVLDKSKKADYRMRIINPDGSEAEMCGNGARCLAAYIVREKKERRKTFTIQTLAGILEAQAKGEVATVRLSDPRDHRPDIALKINQRPLHVQYIDTGVPHTVVFVEGLGKIDVILLGRQIRFHKMFSPRGTNVNFVEMVRPGLVTARTYERGVEDETRACGTGSVASALLAFLQINPEVMDKTGARMKVKTASGEILQVTFDLKDKKISNVRLKGSARFIAQGRYFL